MHDAEAQIRSTLEYVMASAIPSQHKVVLIEALTQALRNQSDADIREQSAHHASTQWEADEVSLLQSFLGGKVAKSWQHADELAMHVAAHLHRRLEDVRAKAIELGLGVSIYYRPGFVAQSTSVE